MVWAAAVMRAAPVWTVMWTVMMSWWMWHNYLLLKNVFLCVSERLIRRPLLFFSDPKEILIFFVSALLFSVLNLLYYNLIRKSIFFRWFLLMIRWSIPESAQGSATVNVAVNGKADHRASGMRSVVCFYMLWFPLKLVFMHITGLSLTFIDIYYTNMLKIYCTFKSKVI